MRMNTGETEGFENLMTVVDLHFKIQSWTALSSPLLCLQFFTLI